MQSSFIAPDASAKALAGPLGELLRNDVDGRFPVEPLQVHRVRAVERLEVRAAAKPEVQRVTVRAGRCTVDRHVEALEAELRIEVERRRDAVSELLDQIVVEFGGG